MLKNETSTEWAKRIDEKTGSFLEDEEFEEMLQLMPGKEGWQGIIKRWKDRGYSEFKIGYTVGELKKRIDSDYIKVNE